MMLSEAKEPPSSEKPSTIAQNSLSLSAVGSDCARAGAPATKRRPTISSDRIQISVSYTDFTRAKPVGNAQRIPWQKMLLQDPATFARPGAEPIPSPTQPQSAPTVPPKIDVAGMNFYYGANRVLHDVTVKMLPNHVTALIGPSGCGKSTFLRSLNRMIDIIPGTRVDGSVCIDGRD